MKPHGAAKNERSQGEAELAANPAWLITEVARLFRTSFDRKMTALGLDRSRWWLISFLCYFEGGTQQELAEAMDIGKAGLGKLVDRMEAEGWVKRKEDARDRRIKRLYLTPAAKPMAREIKRASRQTVAAAVASLSRREIESLNALLTRIKTELQGI